MAIQSMNGSFEDGCCISVSEATNRKPGLSPRIVANGGKSLAILDKHDVVCQVDHNMLANTAKHVPDVICTPSKWFSMSLVIDLYEPMKLDTIFELVKAVWEDVDRVIILNSIKVMVVFSSKEALLKVLSAGAGYTSSFC